jgi:OOP family OmpA-OmpF porin
MSRKITLLILMGFFCLATMFVFAQSEKAAQNEKATQDEKTAQNGKTEFEGMIKSRSGDAMIVQTKSGDITVALNDDTVTQDNRGLFGLDKEKMGNTVLIPGLKVKVHGTQESEGHVVAKRITVDGDDLETSEMIEAGLHPTAEQVAANVQRLEAHQKGIEANQQATEQNAKDIAASKEKIESSMKDIEEHEQRFAHLDDYDVKGQATVKFDTGSSKLSAADQQQLKQLAQSLNQLHGYLVEVTGFADSRGNPAMNTKLSENRAKAVITYLTQQCGVPMRRLVAPGAMGEYGPAQTNETKAGRAENRRVEVKVLVNKGVQGGI